jgi:hypothetical protein
MRESYAIWIVLAVLLALALSSCAKHQNETVDPKAFTLWVIGF